ncbi:hypothetical protein M433DRAFT_72229 [Acidomyces richmondensis BFW]|nr:MAG: hypothetical protein FE78DRAFT_155105 [Acidomyces sp. 'richmondensis']KYG43199.1 hypothetical protein M433DRAFT_72229 [Acidomyces richmondensis BFW]
MSSQLQPNTAPTNSSNPVDLPSPAVLQQSLDNGIWYALSLWPALHLAVQNSWGGPESSEKRDWFAGAVSELLSSRPDTDEEELEIFLLQVMQDEFEVNVEDDSEVDVARTILRLKQSLSGQGLWEGGSGEERMSVLKEVEGRWRERGRMKVDVRVVEEDGEEEEDEEEEDEGFDEDGDVDMDAEGEFVPELRPALAKKKVEPVIDEEGFTKVVGKKKW